MLLQSLMQSEFPMQQPQLATVKAEAQGSRGQLQGLQLQLPRKAYVEISTIGWANKRGTACKC